MNREIFLRTFDVGFCHLIEISSNVVIVFGGHSEAVKLRHVVLEVEIRVEDTRPRGAGHLDVHVDPLARVEGPVHRIDASCTYQSCSGR